VLAWVIDVLVVTLLIFVGVSAVDAVVGPAVHIRLEAAELTNVLTVDKGIVVVDAFVAAALGAGYFAVPWALLSGSPGQLALRMRVRTDTGGETLTLGRALARWILLFPPFATASALTAGVSLLGWVIWGCALVWYLVLLFTTVRSDSKQGLHDRIVHSIVSKRSPGATYGAVDAR
jgi:RDD family protein